MSVDIPANRVGGYGAGRALSKRRAAIGVLAVKATCFAGRSAYASRTLTAPRADGCWPPCSFGERSRPNRPHRAPKEHGRQNATSTRRSHREAAVAKRRNGEAA